MQMRDCLNFYHTVITLSLYQKLLQEKLSISIVTCKRFVQFSKIHSARQQNLYTYITLLDEFCSMTTRWPVSKYIAEIAIHMKTKHITLCVVKGKTE